MISVSSAGVVPVANRPMSKSLSLPSGDCTSLRISALMRSVISLGVPAGAKMPFQPTRLIL
jgi:PAB1-binding protein PBP1